MGTVERTDKFQSKKNHPQAAATARWFSFLLPPSKGKKTNLILDIIFPNTIKLDRSMFGFVV